MKSRSPKPPFTRRSMSKNGLAAARPVVAPAPLPADFPKRWQIDFLLIGVEHRTDTGHLDAVAQIQT
jgi:hypothetical protein